MKGVMYGKSPSPTHSKLCSTRTSVSHLMKHAAIVIFSSSVFFNSRLPSRPQLPGLWRDKIRLLAAAVELAPTATGPVEERSEEVSKQICLIGHCFSK